MGIDVANGPFPTLPLPCDYSGRGLAFATTVVAGSLICLAKVFFFNHFRRSTERKRGIIIIIILLLVVRDSSYCK